MKGYTFFLVGLLAVFRLETSAALNETSATLVCNLLRDGTLIYSGKDCGSYYACKKGSAVLNTCSNGYYFSKDSQSCVPSSEVSCNTDVGNPCENIKDDTFVAVAKSCSDFWYCKGGVGSRGSCGDLNFNQNGQACEYKNVFPCSLSSGDVSEEKINLCAIVPNGRYFGTWQSCEGWQKCNNGVMTSGNCKNSLKFNVDTESCDYADNVSCRQSKPIPGVEPGIGYLDGTPCEHNDLVVSDNATCTGYYMCNNGKYKFGQCSVGFYYDPPTKTCVNRLNAKNNCNRCEDTKLEFVNLFHDGCKGYGYCKKGKMESTSLCPNGNFNELAGACVVGSNKTYPVCEIETDTPATTLPTPTSSSSEPGSEVSTSSTSPTKDPPTHSPNPTEETISSSSTESTKKQDSSTEETIPSSTKESAKEPDSSTSSTKSSTESEAEPTKKQDSSTEETIPSLTKESTKKPDSPTSSTKSSTESEAEPTKSGAETEESKVTEENSPKEETKPESSSEVESAKEKEETSTKKETPEENENKDKEKSGEEAEN